jgi:hypothetical protein
VSDSLRRLAALGLAAALVCVTLAYAGLWTYTVRWQPAADLGVRFAGRTLEFAAVEPGSPAERAGLKRYDLLTALNGEPVESLLDLRDRLRRAEPGEPVRLTVRMAGLDEPRSYDSEMIATTPPREPGARVLSRALARSFPLLLAMLIAGVLFVRSEYLNGWLVGLTLVGMVGAAPLMSMYERIPPDLRGLAVAWKILAAAIGPGFLYFLFAVLPEASPLDRRFPWLKSAWPAGAAVVALPFALYAVASGGATLRDGTLPAFGTFVLVVSWVAALGLGVATFLASAQDASSEEELRGLPLVLLGAAATVPGLLVTLPGQLSPWIELPALLTMFFCPLALCYVAVSHEPPTVAVLFQRGARLFPVLRGRLFGRAHDTKRVLEELARDVAVTSRVEKLVQCLEQGIGRALAPSSFALYFTHGDRLIIVRGDVPEDLREIPLERVLIEDESDDDAASLGSLDAVTPFGPDELVPLIGSDGPPLVGLMVLGPRASDEPYSAEEKRLLETVGRQAAAAVEAGSLGYQLVRRASEK